MNTIEPTCAAIVRLAYGDAETFLHTFRPEEQSRFAAHPLRCYTGNAPTLAAVSATYGRAVVRRWLCVQIADLLTYCGAKTSADSLVGTLAETVITLHAALRVTEVMLFLMYFKGGRYGHFYGQPDPIIITEGLARFRSERHKAVCALMDEGVEATPATPPRKRSDTCTWQEYMDIRRRAEAGDRDAQQLLLPPAERTAAAKG